MERRDESGADSADEHSRVEPREERALVGEERLGLDAHGDGAGRGLATPPPRVKTCRPVAKKCERSARRFVVVEFGGARVGDTRGGVAHQVQHITVLLAVVVDEERVRGVVKRRARGERARCRAIGDSCDMSRTPEFPSEKRSACGVRSRRRKGISASSSRERLCFLSNRLRR